MAIGKIEPTGCCVRKGKVQLRFSFFLQPNNPRYEEHHIQVPIIPLQGYQGEIDAEGNPVSQENYNNWIESLPKKWQNNPFHNHFVYVDANTPNNKIRQLMTKALTEFYGIWAEGEDISKAWKERPLKSKRPFIVGDMSSQNIKKCQNRVTAIIKRVSEFEVRKV